MEAWAGGEIERGGTTARRRPFPSTLDPFLPLSSHRARGLGSPLPRLDGAGRWPLAWSGGFCPLHPSISLTSSTSPLHASHLTPLSHAHLSTISHRPPRLVSLLYYRTSLRATCSDVPGLTARNASSACSPGRTQRPRRQRSTSVHRPIVRLQASSSPTPFQPLRLRPPLSHTFSVPCGCSTALPYSSTLHLTCLVPARVYLRAERDINRDHLPAIRLSQHPGNHPPLPYSRHQDHPSTSLVPTSSGTSATPSLATLPPRYPPVLSDHASDYVVDGKVQAGRRCCEAQSL